MLSCLLLCPDTRTGVLGKTAGLQSKQRPRIKSKETRGSRERGGGMGGGIDTVENLRAIVKAWDVLPRRAGPVSGTWVREV